MKFQDINLLDVGHGIQQVGAIYSDDHWVILCFFPDEEEVRERDHSHYEELDMTAEEWSAFLRQSDLLETEVETQTPEGTIKKAILRKSQRQIDQNISWQVYERDHYHCRYCGRTGIPLTVDHLVLWEVGGPSIEANLVTCCRSCNRERGRMPYTNWLASKYYAKVSKGIPAAIQDANNDLVATLESIPLQRMRSR